MPKMTPGEFADYLRRAAGRVVPEIIAAEAVTVQEALGSAQKQSSGTLSAKDLKSADHPFAVRAPNSAFNPAVINVRSGRFLAGWKAVAPKQSGSSVVSGVVNRTPEAAYMFGTRRMIPRPVKDAVIKSVDQDARQQRLKQAVQNALRV